jgi:hypothetical protein
VVNETLTVAKVVLDGSLYYLVQRDGLDPPPAAIELVWAKDKDVALPQLGHHRSICHDGVMSALTSMTNVPLRCGDQRNGPNSDIAT